MINPDCLQGNDFLMKFTPLIEGMMNLGLTKKQAIKAACSQQFVKDFADTPGWFVSVSKIPKGYKWSDGEKYNKKAVSKGTGKCDSEAYIFLDVENDLYIKGFFASYCFFISTEDGVHYSKSPKELANKICVIKGWKSISPQEITYRLDTTPFFTDSFYNFCHKNGVSLSMMEWKLKQYKESDTQW